MSDLGYFGPDSVTWRVVGDPSQAVGGLRSLLLQALHPLAMAGVAQNTGFADDFWGRLERTGDYVLTVAFGTTEQADAAGARVRRIHPHVRGTDPVTGREYRADDPALLRWVHVAEFESFITCAQRSGLRLSATEVDRYWTEQLVAARLVGLVDDVPASAADVADYFAAVRPELRSSEVAERSSAGLIFAPVPRQLSWLQPLWSSVAGLGVAALPGWARRMYGIPGSRLTDPAADLATDAVLRTVRSLGFRVPRERRLGPAALAGLQRAAAAGYPVAA